MSERENFCRELEPRADRGPKRGQNGDEQGSHPVRERYQSLVRNRNGDNTYGVFGRDNRALKAQLGSRRVRLNDRERRRLAVLGHRLGRGVLQQVATLVTPDTILRWHRQLIARELTYSRRRSGRPAVLAEIRRKISRPDGDRESVLGLHANPRCAEERGPSCRPVDHCRHPEGRRHPAQP